MNGTEQNGTVIHAENVFEQRAKNAWFTKISRGALARVVNISTFPKQSIENISGVTKIYSDADKDRLDLHIAIGFIITAMENAGFEQEAYAIQELCIERMHDGEYNLQTLRTIAETKLEQVSPELLKRLKNNHHIRDDV
jgi:hypothetical protein